MPGPLLFCFLSCKYGLSLSKGGLVMVEAVEESLKLACGQRNRRKVSVPTF